MIHCSHSDLWQIERWNDTSSVYLFKNLSSCLCSLNIWTLCVWRACSWPLSTKQNNWWLTMNGAQELPHYSLPTAQCESLLAIFGSFTDNLYVMFLNAFCIGQLVWNSMKQMYCAFTPLCLLTPHLPLPSLPCMLLLFLVRSSTWTSILPVHHAHGVSTRLSVTFYPLTPWLWIESGPIFKEVFQQGCVSITFP